MVPRTRHEQNMEQIAHILYCRLVADPMFQFSDAQAVNEGTGFDFDVRYDDGDYADDDTYSEARQVALSDTDLLVCFEDAVRFL